MSALAVIQKSFQKRRILSLFVFSMLLVGAPGLGDPRLSNARNQHCLELLTAETPGWAPIEGFGTPERWSFDGHDRAKYYDQDFTDLYAKTGAKSLSEILKRRKSHAQKNNVLDIFGSGFFVEDQALADSITGIRLGPFSRESDDKSFKTELMQLPATPTEILGDATNPKTWEALKASMKSRGIPSMDLVAMRPMGGWQQAPFTQTARQNSLAISLMVENVIQLLSADGQFYFVVDIPQLPGDLRQDPVLQELVKRIETETNFHLHLVARLSNANTTYELSGVLYPK